MKLYNDPHLQERECGKCHEIKPYIEFKNRSDFPGIKRSTCKKCDIQSEAERLQMKSWTNKLQAIKFITKNSNKCQFCGEAGIEKLPILDFHHPNPELSKKDAKEKGFWRSVRYKNWNTIKKEIIDQKLMIVCRNCHSNVQTTIFSQFHDEILKYDYKEITPQMIPLKYRRDIVKAFIRKKQVLIDMWDGKCQKCGLGINIENIEYLPALEIHHQTPSLKRGSYRYFYRISDIERIKSIFIKEDCTCLCRNCHIMIQATFYNKNKEEIFSRFQKKFGGIN